MPASYYGTLQLADTYFDTERLNSQLWFRTSSVDKAKAMRMATRALDNLNWAGDKADSEQENQFPRGTDTEVPDPILRATYEIAFQALLGVDLDSEVDSLGLSSEGIGSLRVTYNEVTRQNVRNGIISQTAWLMIQPYLRRSDQVTLERGT